MKGNLCNCYTEVAVVSIFSQSELFYFCNHEKVLIVSTYYPIEITSFMARM